MQYASSSWLGLLGGVSAFVFLSSCVPVSDLAGNMAISDLIGNSVVEVSGVVTAESGTPIESVNVRIPLDNRHYETLTNASGAYTLRLPNDELPSGFLVLAHKDGYVPAGESFARTGNQRLRVDIVLEEAERDQVFLDDFITLHHLGDDSFSGGINSQFQMRTEGTSFEIGFDLDPEFLNYQDVQISLLAKGLQQPNELIINGKIIGLLDSSAGSGRFTRVTFDFGEPALFLKPGANTLRVNSHRNSDGDYDDFEFTNIMLEFSN